MCGAYQLVEYDKQKGTGKKLPFPKEGTYHSVSNVNNEYIFLFSGSESAWKFDLKARVFEKLAITGDPFEPRRFHLSNVWRNHNGIMWLVVFGGNINRNFPNTVYLLNLGINKALQYSQ